jgi:hypothetical protein
VSVLRALFWIPKVALTVALGVFHIHLEEMISPQTEPLRFASAFLPGSVLA